MIVRDVLEGVDSAMSSHRMDSEIAAFNRHGTDDFEASPEMIEALQTMMTNLHQDLTCPCTLPPEPCSDSGP